MVDPAIMADLALSREILPAAAALSCMTPYSTVMLLRELRGKPNAVDHPRGRPPSAEAQCFPRLVKRLIDRQLDWLTRLGQAQKLPTAPRGVVASQSFLRLPLATPPTLPDWRNLVPQALYLSCLSRAYLILPKDTTAGNQG